MDPNPPMRKDSDNLLSINPAVTTHTLLDLSTEVLIEILAYLPAVSLFSVQRTCRTIRDIITGTTYFQYTMRAYINGVNDLLPPDFPHSERLELLRRHEQSWDSLQLNISTKYHTASVTRVGATFACPFILQDGYLIYECFMGGLQRYGYADLCSASRGEELRWVHITIADGHLPIASTVTVEFAVDHDLMVAIRYCVTSDLIIESLMSHSKWRQDIRVAVVELTFFQFTTGEPHTHSSTHTVSLPRSGQPFTYVSQEVLGDHVLVTTWSLDSKAAFYLVSWKTGAITFVSISSR
jgi:hypothetical protein